MAAGRPAQERPPCLVAQISMPMSCSAVCSAPRPRSRTARTCSRRRWVSCQSEPARPPLGSAPERARLVGADVVALAVGVDRVDPLVPGRGPDRIARALAERLADHRRGIEALQGDVAAAQLRHPLLDQRRAPAARRRVSGAGRSSPATSSASSPRSPRSCASRSPASRPAAAHALDPLGVGTALRRPAPRTRPAARRAGSSTRAIERSSEASCSCAGETRSRPRWRCSSSAQPLGEPELVHRGDPLALGDLERGQLLARSARRRRGSRARGPRSSASPAPARRRSAPARRRRRRWSARASARPRPGTPRGSRRRRAGRRPARRSSTPPRRR